MILLSKIQRFDSQSPIFSEPIACNSTANQVPRCYLTLTETGHHTVPSSLLWNANMYYQSNKMLTITFIFLINRNYRYPCEIFA